LRLELFRLDEIQQGVGITTSADTGEVVIDASRVRSSVEEPLVEGIEEAGRLRPVTNAGELFASDHRSDLLAQAATLDFGDGGRERIFVCRALEDGETEPFHDLLRLATGVAGGSDSGDLEL